MFHNSKYYTRLFIPCQPQWPTKKAPKCLFDTLKLDYSNVLVTDTTAVELVKPCPLTVLAAAKPVGNAVFQ